MVWRDDDGNFHTMPIEAADLETVQKAANQYAVKNKINRKFKYELIN
jgi:hypothetical protein